MIAVVAAATASTGIRRSSLRGAVPATTATRTSAAGATMVIAALLLRRLSLRWGATADEVSLPLPGDDLHERTNLVATRAITIAASPAEIWPWIVQLGQGRGGFYSYDALENLLGCDIHSADVIVPEWQHVDVGSEIRLAPAVPLTVVHVEPGHALVLRGGVGIGQVPAPYDFTWAFVLLDGAAGGSRLLVRERYQYLRWWSALLVEPVEFVSLVMSLRMLRGLRDRSVKGAPPPSSGTNQPIERQD
jgi:hypothetical protein